MRTFLILLPIFASLHGATTTTPSTGEIETIETLMNFRLNKEHVWRDPITDQLLHRVNNKGETVQAAYDADITLSPFNAPSIIANYLAEPNSPPQATKRSEELIGLVSNQNWKALLELVKNYRLSKGEIAKDCFGNGLFELCPTENKPAANLRDITNISTLIDAIEPAIRAVSPLPERTTAAFTAAERTNYDAFTAFRTAHNVMCVDQRTGGQLYKIINDALVKAVKDTDVLPDLSNLVTLMAAAVANKPAAITVGLVPSTLSPVFSDANFNRLYQLVEDARRAQGRLLIDAIGRPLVLENRVQVVDMQNITDIPSLLKAVFEFFPETIRPTI